ncbi:MAG: hypothetical protein GW808_10915 [Sphingomonadales bacterium]|nr:hypothetical protein [Sphingomonadales bacterium]NCO49734.1 hypothetical protein [Sphingomonadales bacterium]NCP00985.1 hypothetical protein [Sphingomonadales bacterium]NCP25644.1 hypothetical protein [Sphingomonadales bacterium]NCP49121.1 hypothetical protein [Sphingomonadales bacterium]
MSKIRHNRPYLRYLDNLRREMKVASGPSSLQQPVLKSEKTIPQRLLRERDEKAYNRHIEAFDTLPENSQKALDHLFDGANTLLEARFNYIESIGTRKRVAKRKLALEEAYEKMRLACAAYNLHCNNERRKGKPYTREWFAKLRTIMGSEWTHFEEIDELIKETHAI